MTNGSNERLDRIEHNVEEVTNSLKEVAVRQQYHDEAFVRHAAEMKAVRKAIAADAENIQSRHGEAD